MLGRSDLEVWRAAEQSPYALRTFLAPGSLKAARQAREGWLQGFREHISTAMIALHY